MATLFEDRSLITCINITITRIILLLHSNFVFQVSELLNPESMLDIAILTQHKIQMTEDL